MMRQKCRQRSARELKFQLSPECGRGMANPLCLLGRKIMQGDMHPGREGLGSHGMHFGATTASLSVLRASLKYEEQEKKPSRESRKTTQPAYKYILSKAFKSAHFTANSIQGKICSFSSILGFRQDEGAAVAERLDCSPPIKADRVQSPAGSLPMPLAGWFFSGISNFPRPCIPTLLHPHLISPVSSLKTSVWGLKLLTPRTRRSLTELNRDCYGSRKATSVALNMPPPPRWLIRVKSGENGAAPERKKGRGNERSPKKTRPGIESCFDLVGGEQSTRPATAASGKERVFACPDSSSLVLLVRTLLAGARSQDVVSSFCRRILTSAPSLLIDESFNFADSSFNHTQNALERSLLTVLSAVNQEPPAVRRPQFHTTNVKAVQSGGVMVLLLASHPGEPGSIPGGVTPGFPLVAVMPDDAAGRRVSSGISCFPRPCIPALPILKIYAALKVLRMTVDSNCCPDQGPSTSAVAPRSGRDQGTDPDSATEKVDEAQSRHHNKQGTVSFRCREVGATSPAE
ncbi:hypothetical protein PR048_027898 [Dryococelus australis]|uniref:Uncharacterized protein n=1 Tax=Dryococelus australis TaxID=614101 RepID=A0ABQ9GHU3_9NEOP|nr:hypothetical protein PR048_027898 [Dryococelus australis]